MNHRKYPFSLFLTGVLFNMVRNWLFLVASILLFFIRIFVPSIPVVAPVVFIILWMSMAFIIQYRFRKTILSKSESEDFNAFADKVLDSDSTKSWDQAARDCINDKTGKNKS